MRAAASLDALLAGEPEATCAVARELRDEGVCAVAPGRALPPEFLARLSRTAVGFFKLPGAAKMAVALAASGNLRGYVGYSEERTNGLPDLKESFEFGQERRTRGRTRPYHRMYGANVWPDAANAPEFRAVLEAYSQVAEAAGMALVEALICLLETPETAASCRALRRGRASRFSRVNYYCEPAGISSGADRLVAHTDNSLVTLAYQDAPGLEVERRSDGWSAGLPPGSLAVFTGELAEIWSGGTYRAARHRVRNGMLARERVSVTSFFLPDLSARVLPLPGAGGGRQAEDSFVVGEREWARMERIFPTGTHAPPAPVPGEGAP